MWMVGYMCIIHQEYNFWFKKKAKKHTRPYEILWMKFSPSWKRSSGGFRSPDFWLPSTVPSNWWAHLLVSSRWPTPGVFFFSRRRRAAPILRRTGTDGRSTTIDPVGWFLPVDGFVFFWCSTVSRFCWWYTEVWKIHVLLFEGKRWGCTWGTF